MALRDIMPWRWGQGRVPAERREAEERNPVLALQREMNRLFDEFWRAFDLEPFRFGRLESFAPRVELKEHADRYTVSAELPGMDQNDVKVTVDDQLLRIEGEKRHEETGEEGGWSYSERSYGAFSRVIPLPSDVVADKVTARFSKGVLTVELPKDEKARKSARKIEIRTE
ncbi:MAG: molecular chaperone Hsp20 [Planctomycetota bacterium]|nr:MAG: molecular chaperone Hsp20 [Planctomycetota bacterium]